MTKYLLLCIISISAFAHDHRPESNQDFSQNIELTSFFQLEDFKVKFKISNSNKYSSNQQSYLIGSYYLISKFDKIGFFASFENGNRYSNDWIIENSKWKWIDTSNRQETLYHFVYSKKIKSSEMPLMYEFHHTYLINQFNNHSTFILKPSLHYFYFNDGVISYSIRVELPLYFALNYDENGLYKKGIYLSSIKHLNKELSMALTFKYLEETWVDSEDSLRLRPTQPYEVTDQSTSLGFNIIYSI